VSDGGDAAQERVQLGVDHAWLYVDISDASTIYCAFRRP